MKNDLKKRLRRQMRISETVSLGPCRRLVAHFLNLSFREDDWPAADQFWEKVIAKEMREKFHVFSEDVVSLRKRMVSFRSFLFSDLLRWHLFSRLRELCQFETIGVAANRLRLSSPCFGPLFDETSVSDFTTRVSHSPVVTNAEGRFYWMKSFEFLKLFHVEETKEMMERALCKFEMSLRSFPHNREALCYAAFVSRRLAEMEYAKEELEIRRKEREEKNRREEKRKMTIEYCLASSPLSLLSPILKYLKRARKVDPEDNDILFWLASFYVQSGSFVKGGELLLQCVEREPERVEFLLSYGLLLLNLGEIIGFFFVVRASLISFSSRFERSWRWWQRFNSTQTRTKKK
mmetsp:Transcript_41865/g.58474  ORF Transcript_41865/g.58474 Transcript_41865/m.58474 type:complete len:348 (+) Transcript_41865:357-1400(+)